MGSGGGVLGERPPCAGKSSASSVRVAAVCKKGLKKKEMLVQELNICIGKKGERIRRPSTGWVIT